MTDVARRGWGQWFGYLFRTGQAADRPAADVDYVAASQDALQKFTASIVHELRTPLSSLSVEIELVLRRDRSPAAYRETLVRLGQQVEELIELTNDLAILGDQPAFAASAESTTDFSAMIEQLSRRYDSSQLLVMVVDQDLRVRGDAALLARAFRLLCDHAMGHQGHGFPLTLKFAPTTAGTDLDGPGDTVDVLLSASEPGFTRRTWRHLDPLMSASPLDGGPGLVPLQTAATIFRLSGGEVTLTGPETALCVKISLPLGFAQSTGPTS